MRKQLCWGRAIPDVLKLKYADYDLLKEEIQATHTGSTSSSLSIQVPTFGKCKHWGHFDWKLVQYFKRSKVTRFITYTSQNGAVSQWDWRRAVFYPRSPANKRFESRVEAPIIIKWLRPTSLTFWGLTLVILKGAQGK